MDAPAHLPRRAAARPRAAGAVRRAQAPARGGRAVELPVLAEQDRLHPRRARGRRCRGTTSPVGRHDRDPGRRPTGADAGARGAPTGLSHRDPGPQSRLSGGGPRGRAHRRRLPRHGRRRATGLAQRCRHLRAGARLARRGRHRGRAAPDPAQRLRARDDPGPIVRATVPRRPRDPDRALARGALAGGPPGRGGSTGHAVAAQGRDRRLRRPPPGPDRGGHHRGAQRGGAGRVGGARLGGAGRRPRARTRGHLSRRGLGRGGHRPRGPPGRVPPGAQRARRGHPHRVGRPRTGAARRGHRSHRARQAHRHRPRRGGRGDRGDVRDARRLAARERAGAAGPQQRPPDDRSLPDLAVRAARQGDLRAATGVHGAHGGERGDGQPAGHRARPAGPARGPGACAAGPGRLGARVRQAARLPASEDGPRDGGVGSAG